MATKASLRRRALKVALIKEFKLRFHRKPNHWELRQLPKLIAAEIEKTTELDTPTPEVGLDTLKDAGIIR